MNPKYVTSLELSKKLFEVGFKKETGYYWVEHKEIDKPAYSNCIVLGSTKDLINYPREFWNIYTAPLTDELLEELPSCINQNKIVYKLEIYKFIYDFNVGYFEKFSLDNWKKGKVKIFHHLLNNSLPNALAHMWLYLKKEGVI